jgi:hypothetical protein
VTGGTSLACAITVLAAEKRAVGYKYDAEERVLARFEEFCWEEFPGLGTVTRASAEAWITAARRRGVRPATLQGLAAPVRELARWLGRRGTEAYVLPAGVLPRPARYVPQRIATGPWLRTCRVSAVVCGSLQGVLPARQQQAAGGNASSNSPEASSRARSICSK